MSGKYMAYVGSYSYSGTAKGITVYDVDVENGRFIYRCEMEVNNSSYLTVSHDRKTLYSIADEGVVSFRILENGSITRLNSANIKGMRGCHISTDEEDRYLFEMCIRDRCQRAHADYAVQLCILPAGVSVYRDKICV